MEVPMPPTFTHGYALLIGVKQQTERHTERWPVLIDHLWLMQRGPGDPAWRYIHRVDLTEAAP